MEMFSSVSDNCEVVWETTTYRLTQFDGYIMGDNHIYCYLLKEDDGRVSVNWPKWEYYSVTHLTLIDDEWEEDYDQEQPYYPGFNGDVTSTDVDWEKELSYLQEGERVQVHPRRYAFCYLDEDGTFNFDEWDNGESSVWFDFIKKDGKIITCED